MTARQENVKWVDGFRGLASFLVVVTHTVRAFDGHLFDAADGPDKPLLLFQLPFFRVLTQGRIGVAIFSLVTGYVCALKPIRQCRAGKPEEALSSIAKSAFRRIPRLVLPTTIATVIIWALCQLGAFEIAHRSDSWWIDNSSPRRNPTFGTAVQGLLFELICTWTRGSNLYDNNQWSLFPLLRGSFTVYAMLVATTYVQPRYRMMVSLSLVVYYYVCGESTFGFPFFFGAFLSDLSQQPGHVAWLATHRWPGLILSPILVTIGLFLASFPDGYPDYVPWSNWLLKLSFLIFPKDSDLPRMYTGLGLLFIALGIHFSNHIKTVLSNKYLLWLGKNSFAVYLLHGTLMRTLLTYMYYGISLPPNVTNDKGESVPGPALSISGRVRFWFWLPIWFAITYTAAHFWTKYVDPWCAQLTQRLENYCFEETQAQPANKEYISPLPR